MAKLNYQKAARKQKLQRQFIVNSTKPKKFKPKTRRNIMRFGKYKYFEFRDIPVDYIKWAILNINDEYTLDNLIRELQRREPFYRT